MRRLLDEKVRNIRRATWLWDRDEARRLYLAGGGTDADFDSDHGRFMAAANEFVESVENDSYAHAGGGLHYIVAARRSSGQA